MAMSQVIEFTYHHWILWLTLVVVIVLLIIEESRSRIKGVRKISPQESIHLINKENALIIYTRNKEAFREGHIANAKNMSQEETDDYAAALNSYKSSPLLVVCYAGVSSLKVAQQLKKAGFEKVFSLSGGMNGWKAAGLPV